MNRLRAVTFGLTIAALFVMTTQGCSCKNASVVEDRNLSFNPTTLSFARVPIGNTSRQTVTLTHVGTSGTIEFATISFEGLSTDEFSFEGPGSMTLEPGDSTTLTVIYSPVDSNADNGHLVIRHNVVQLNNVTRIPVSALGQVAELIANPHPIDFGHVHVGDSKDLDVILTNVGSDAVNVTNIGLRIDGSPDFEITAISHKNGDKLPVELMPGEDMGLVINYKPAGDICETSVLQVVGDKKGAKSYWNFSVQGCQVGPRIVITPGVIDFDWVSLDETAEGTLHITNAGNAPLEIQPNDIQIFPGSLEVENLAVSNVPTEPIIIPDESDASVAFKVQWTAKTPRPDDGAPIGHVSVASNDAAHSPTMIPIYGKVEAPLLITVPNDMINMGYGAKNVPVQRQLTLINEGHGLAKIYTMEIVDASPNIYGEEFTFGHDSTFPVLQGQGDGLIPGFEQKSVTIFFTNKGPDTGKVTATLRMTTNVKGKETIEIPIVAQRVSSPVCRIGILPATMNFGTVAYGFPESQRLFLANDGSGDCIFRELRISDCGGGIFGGGANSCPQPLTGNASQAFSVQGIPAPGTVLTPGQRVSMTAIFNPPKQGGLFAGLLSNYYGLLGIKADDAATRQPTIIPACPAGSSCAANLRGAGGIAKVSVLPAEVNFGVNTIGCCSQTHSVCIYNSGNAPLKLTDIVFKGCTPEFKSVNVPALPRAILGGGNPLCFQTQYKPLDEGPDACNLQISVTDRENPIVVIPMRGEGTYETQQIDEFKQVSGKEVDILFVIDDSGSMCDKQEVLSKSFSDFIQHADVWENEYHIGVVSVNVLDDKVIGRLNAGNASKTPRYLTPTSGGNFSQLVNLGCNTTDSDQQEAGLQAAQAALSAPNTTDTGISCSSDTQCKNDPNICPDPTKCGYTCIDGTCGGWNRGFLRDDAQLEVVALADEEDQSAAGIDFYTDFLKNIKGWYNVGMMHFNAIVGTGGTDQCADHGRRYLEVVRQTDGLSGSICESTFAPIMNEIGTVTFVPKVQFFLSRLADPASIEVKVNGVECKSPAWSYDVGSNSIVFDEDGSCMPQAEDQIWVKYQTLCIKC